MLTQLKECPFSIRIRTSSDGQKLVVARLDAPDTHSHEIIKEVFQYSARQRKLTPHEAEEVKAMLKVKANKKLVQSHCSLSLSKKITLKDLHNLGMDEKENDFTELLEEMKKVEGAVVEVLVDESNAAKAFYFQSGEMKATFAAYPELLFIDATYKLNDLRMPLYVIMNEDGNGESEVVCLWIVALEDRHTISSLMDIFKAKNACWESIRVIMADKDMTERMVLKEKLPQADIQICLFHTLRTFRREVTMEKMGISVGERNLSLEMLEKLCYCQTEEQYQIIHEQMLESVPRSVTAYFEANWNTIREEWVDGLKSKKATFLNRTNNRVEALNQKLKSVISRYSGMTVFFRDLMKCITILKNERNCRAANMELKVPVTTCEGHFKSYQDLLTPYAYKYMREQLMKSDQVKIITADFDTEKIRFKRNGEHVECSCELCTCGFQTAMQLPCHHIIAARKHFQKDVYAENLCAIRWTKSYFRSSHRLFRVGDEEPSTTDAVTVHRGANKPDILTELQKYRRCFNVAQTIAQTIAEQGMGDFKINLSILNQIQDVLHQGKRFKVAEIEDTDGLVMSSSASQLLQEETSLNSDSEEDNSNELVQPCISTEKTDTEQMKSSPPTSLLQEETSLNSDSEEDNSNELVQPCISTEKTDTEQMKSSPPTSLLQEETPSNLHDSENELVQPCTLPEKTDTIQTTAENGHVQPRTASETIDMFKANANQAVLQEKTNCLDNVKLPTKMVKRGRPKGAGLTVIGLPKKRTRDRPVAMRLRSPTEKASIMLGWFVDESVINKVLHSLDRSLIEDDQVDIRPEHLPMKCLDENISMSSIRQYFTFDAWKKVERMLQVLSEKGVWYCQRCNTDLHSASSMCCDSCLDWFHLKCLNKKVPPKTKFWFCRACHIVELA